MASFKMPMINDNPDGWGPPMDLVPKKFQDMPYAPFSKSDKLGKAADWTQDKPRRGDNGPDEGGTQFTMVDNKVVPRANNYGRGRGGFRGGFRGGRGGRFGDRGGDRGRDPRARGGGDTRRNDWGRRGGRGGLRRNEDRRHMQRESSVEVGSDWVQLEEFTTASLNKVSVKTLPEGTDLAQCGSLPLYDRALDRVSVKAPRPLLLSPEREFPSVTTTDDPVIRRLAGEGKGTVFATGAILALLMTAPRAVQSWDVIVQRIGGKLFFDKRDGSMVDTITVNETSQSDAPKDEKNMQPEDALNSYQQLSKEATGINANFIKMAVDESQAASYPEENPFVEDVENIAQKGYRYRQWVLDDDVTLVARCDLDAHSPSPAGGEPAPMYIRTLNEYFEPNLRFPTNWRAKLDQQRSAVLATAVYNNSAKLARWTVEALLADAAQIKFGFVSRTKATDGQRHVVLGTQMFRPKEFATQIALQTANMWGVLKHVIGLCYKNLEDGDKGVILKDPNKALFRIFKVPDDAFESEVDEGEGEEEDELGGTSSFVA